MNATLVTGKGAHRKNSERTDINGFLGGFIPAVDDPVPIDEKTAALHHALINLGGDIRAVGPRLEGSPWRIGICHPRRPGEVCAELARGHRCTISCVPGTRLAAAESFSQRETDSCMVYILCRRGTTLVSHNFGIPSWRKIHE